MTIFVLHTSTSLCTTSRTILQTNTSQYSQHDPLCPKVLQTDFTSSRCDARLNYLFSHLSPVHVHFHGLVPGRRLPDEQQSHDRTKHQALPMVHSWSWRLLALVVQCENLQPYLGKKEIHMNSPAETENDKDKVEFPRNGTQRRWGNIEPKSLQ